MPERCDMFSAHVELRCPVLSAMGWIRLRWTGSLRIDPATGRPHGKGVAPARPRVVTHADRAGKGQRL
jgi:hypothetical protein